MFTSHCRFANFETPDDAAEALKELNGAPPLHLNISFAKKRADAVSYIEILSSDYLYIMFYVQFCIETS